MYTDEFIKVLVKCDFLGISNQYTCREVPDRQGDIVETFNLDMPADVDDLSETESSG